MVELFIFRDINNLIERNQTSESNLWESIKQRRLLHFVVNQSERANATASDALELFTDELPSKVETSILSFVINFGNLEENMRWS